jgi:murein DD-endopeptidase MepM/ murein hydrolase activator NlpD
VHNIAAILFAVTHFLGYHFHLRTRYVLTRHNHLRLRYVSVILIFLLTSLSAVTLISQNSNALGRAQVAFLDTNSVLSDNDSNIIDGRVSLASLVPNEMPEPPPLNREIVVEPGDALGVVMEKNGIGSGEATTVIKAMKEHYDPRDLRVGQKIEMHFDEADDAYAPVFREMKIKLNPMKTLVVARAGEDFRANLQEKEVKKVVRARKATVENSLYGSAAKAGIPQGVVAKAIHIYSWNIDFQRDIRPNDKIEIMYESYETDSGYVAKNGDILYAKLTTGGREIPLYRFEMNDGRVDYFQPDGRSIKRTLMKTPINGARMSSGYGKRRHPVLGYNKMHKGIDFAAPTGTPIFAAGDGVIEKAGWFSSYGKYVRIRHNSQLKTAYAHMSNIKPTVKVGSRVKQGQVIGYVGTTGRSTGAHLHYEVLSNDAQVNPRSVNLPTGEELEGKDKSRFKQIMSKTRQQFASALEIPKVADASQEDDENSYN